MGRGAFTFSPARRDFARVGWQCVCRHPSHPPRPDRPGTICQATRTYRNAEQEQRVLRFLKWWSIQGLHLVSKDAHGAVRAYPPDLPSMAALDAMEPAGWPEA